MSTLSDTFSDEQREKYPRYYRFCMYEEELELLRWLVYESIYELGVWEYGMYRAGPDLVVANVNPEMLLCQYLDERYHEVMREKNAMIEEMIGDDREEEKNAE